MSHFVYEHVPGIGLGNRRPKVTGGVGALLPTGYRIYKETLDILLIADTFGELVGVVSGLPDVTKASLENPLVARSSRRSMRVESTRGGTGVSSKQPDRTYTSREGSTDVASTLEKEAANSLENPDVGETIDPAELREDE